MAATLERRTWPIQRRSIFATMSRSSSRSRHVRAVRSVVMVVLQLVQFAPLSCAHLVNRSEQQPARALEFGRHFLLGPPGCSQRPGRRLHDVELVVVRCGKVFRQG